MARRLHIAAGPQAQSKSRNVDNVDSALVQASAVIHRLQGRAVTLTAAPEWDAWLARQDSAHSDLDAWDAIAAEMSATVEAIGVDRLSELAVLEPLGAAHHLPRLYQRALVQRAMRAVGRSGSTPSLDDIVIGMVEPVRPVVRLLAVRTDEGWRDMAAPKTWAEYRADMAAWEEWTRLGNWIRDFSDRMACHCQDTELCAVSEDVLKEQAEELADEHKASFEMQQLADADMSPEQRKLACPRAWVRALRRRAQRARLYWMGALQLTGGPRELGLPKFCDNYILARWKERQHTAHEMAKCHHVVWSDGRSSPLWDIMLASRRAALNRLYAMTCGLEEIADRLGMVAVFVTLTLPSEWHTHGQRNTNWDEECHPADAGKALMGYWAKFRSRLCRKDIKTLGVRVVESHGDGCPHLHALLFMPPEAVPVTDAALRTTRPDEWDELPTDQPRKRDTKAKAAAKAARRAQKAALRAQREAEGKPLRVATKLVTIDRDRGRAATYVIKYLLKALNVTAEEALKGADDDAKADVQRALATDTSTLEIDNDDGEHLENFDRHRAIAAERHDRRYEFLGVHGVQRIWQRLYTIDDKAFPENAPTSIREARAAIQNRRPADALIALGAVDHPHLRDPDAPRVSLRYVEVETAYGETRQEPDAIVDEATGWTMPLKDDECTLEYVPQAKDGQNAQQPTERTIADSVPRESADAGHWYEDEHVQAVMRLIAERQSNPRRHEWCANMRVKVGVPAGPAPRQQRGGMMGCQVPPTAPTESETAALSRQERALMAALERLLAARILDGADALEINRLRQQIDGYRQAPSAANTARWRADSERFRVERDIRLGEMALASAEANDERAHEVAALQHDLDTLRCRLDQLRQAA